MARVLVTDGNTRSALAVVRSLGRAGYDVVVAAPGRRSLASVSKYCSGSAVFNPHNLKGAADNLSAIVGALAPDLIVPTTDHTIWVLLTFFSGTVRGVPVAVPPASAYWRLSDKEALLERCRALDIPTPRTLVAETASDALEAVRAIGPPCVMKPHSSVYRTESTLQHTYVRHVGREKDVAEAVAALSPGSYPVLVQERIDGSGEGLFFLFDRGDCVASFAHRRLREFPPSGGASTYRESIPLPSDVFDTSRRLLEEESWHGPAMVEFKRSAESGTAYIMEVNGRFWGSLQLAIDAGIDFPRLMVDGWLGGGACRPAAYEEGMRTRWLWGDIEWMIENALTAIRIMFESRSVAVGLRELASAGRRLAQRAAGEKLEVLRWHDPLPFLYETRLALPRHIRRCARVFARE